VFLDVLLKVLTPDLTLLIARFFGAAVPMLITN